MPLLRCFQTCTAAAALFALLGACGLAPPRSQRVIVRPRPPRTEITIRSLTGVWDATINTPEGRTPLTLSVVQSGDALTAQLTFRERSWDSRPAPPARIDDSGGFVLVFGPSPEIVLRGRASDNGVHIGARVEGLELRPAVVDFFRH
jgi:hypothetical protein